MTRRDVRTEDNISGQRWKWVIVLRAQGILWWEEICTFGAIFAPTIRVTTPAFTRFHSSTYYTLLCQYLRSDCNLRPHYIYALTQFAFIGLLWMAYFTYLRSCKGNPKVMSVVITHGLGTFLPQSHILGLTLINMCQINILMYFFIYFPWPDIKC